MVGADMTRPSGHRPNQELIPSPESELGSTARNQEPGTGWGRKPAAGARNKEEAWNPTEQLEIQPCCKV